MEPLDPALVAIHRTALFLHERIEIVGAAGELAIPPDFDRVREERWARWNEVIGGQERLERRVAAAGWSSAEVDAVLAGTAAPSGAVRNMPEWLQVLRRTMTAAPSSEREAFPDLPFGDILAPFIAIGEEMLHARCQEGFEKLPHRAARSLLGALGESLADILGPCLLSEFAVDRPAGADLLAILVADLESSVGDERYQAFVEQHLADGLRGLLVKYPVAGRLAASRVAMWVDATAEFLDRLADDRTEIASHLLRMPEDGVVVVDVEPRLSDPHDHGRSVSIVIFSDGSKVVYKPRSLAPESAWQAFVSILGGRRAMLAARVIDRGSYGWMEHVAPRGLDDRDEIRIFYRSAGSLLCLARALSVKDLHFENIVAAGCRPVPIDLETIAQPSLHSETAGTLDRIAAMREALLDDTVWAAEALPRRYSLSDRAPMDISAFADMSDTTRRRPVWKGLGTDAIALSFEEEPIPSANLPRCGDRAWPPADFVGDIVAGFEETWTALVRARHDITATGGLLDRISAMPVRFIVRPTEIYYRVLARALAPDRLRNGLDYSLELEALNRAVGETGAPPDIGRVADAEIEALHRGDIPRFTVQAGGSAVFDGAELLAPDMIRHSGVDTIRRRLESMTPEQLDVERRIIFASFGAARWGAVSAPAAKLNLATPPLSGDEAMEAALSIGRSIAGEARLRSDGGCSWIGIAYDHRSAGPAAAVLNESFYEGTTGIGLFLAALHSATGERMWAELARGALTDARRIVRETPAQERSATVAHFGRGLSGFGGLVYGLALAADFLGSEELRNDAGRLASWIDADAVEAHAQWDLLGGSIGAVPGLLALGMTIDARTAARRCCDNHQQPDLASSVRGFGHGPTGAAATLALATGNALDAERLFGMVERSADRPHDGALSDGPVGWCKGPIGQALARFALNARLSKLESQDIAGLERAIGEAVATPHALDQLCCGLFGGVDALLVAARHGREDLSEAASVLARALMARADDSGGFRLLAGLPAGVGSVGLFQGMSGIGYTLLRLARPQSFPSILMTEWRT